MGRILTNLKQQVKQTISHSNTFSVVRAVIKIPHFQSVTELSLMGRRIRVGVMWTVMGGNENKINLDYTRKC